MYEAGLTLMACSTRLAFSFRRGRPPARILPMRLRPIAVCLFLAATLAFAQSDRGTITGTVGDPAGAVVAGAPIEARNVETGAVYQAATSTTGNYTIAQLPAGTYELTVTVPGFKK